MKRRSYERLSSSTRKELRNFLDAGDRDSHHPTLRLVKLMKTAFTIFFVASVLLSFSKPIAAAEPTITISNVIFLSIATNAQNPEKIGIKILTADEAKSVDLAVAHLLMSKTGRAILERFATISNTVTVFVNTEHANFYRTKGNFILWDPSDATLFENGSSVSPSIVLLHELAHALRANENFLEFVHANKSKIERYDDREEMRVIRLVETPAARELGEGTRTSHGGHMYTSITSDSVTPAAMTKLTIAEALGNDR